MCHGWMVSHIYLLFSETLISPRLPVVKEPFRIKDITETNEAIVTTKQNMSQETGLMSSNISVFFLLLTDLTDAKWACAGADQH